MFSFVLSFLLQKWKIYPRLSIDGLTFLFQWIFLLVFVWFINLRVIVEGVCFRDTLFEITKTCP